MALMVLLVSCSSTGSKEVQYDNNKLKNPGIPEYKENPLYPKYAARKGVGGWVKMSFDITEDGFVTNIRVVDASPRRKFDSSAKKALSKWKYSPKTVDGITVVNKDLDITLTYSE